jgi:hypothetical protein
MRYLNALNVSLFGINVEAKQFYRVKHWINETLNDTNNRTLNMHFVRNSRMHGCLTNKKSSGKQL